MTADAGIPIARPTVSVPVKLDQHGCLDEDISCRKCGYNLHSLSLSAQCPECGTAVGRSLQGDFLRFAEPDWVRSLVSGMGWIAISIAVGLPAMLQARIMYANWGFGYRWVTAAQYGMMWLLFIGCWMLTKPDPGCSENTSAMSARRLARLTQGTVVLIITVLLSTPQIPFNVYRFAALFGEAINVVSTIALLSYTRQLALRIPDAKMAAYCRIVLWTAGVLLSGAVTMQLLCGIGSLRGSTLKGTMCAVYSGEALLCVWLLYLCLRLRKAFKEAARLSAATWAAGPIAMP